MVVGAGEINPHKLLPFDRPLGGSRVFSTPTHDVNVVQTSPRSICFRLVDASGCVHGLLRQGVNWFITNDGSDNDLVLVGIAADAVSRVDLVSGRLHRRAALSGDIWSVDWPNGQSAFGTTTIGGSPVTAGHLIVHYRDGRPKATISL